MREAPYPLVVGPKLLVPALRPETISRDRVSRLIVAASEHPLTVVRAPAGYGKTTAVVKWLETVPEAHAWVSLDPQDNDPRRLCAHLLAALDRMWPGAMVDAERAMLAGSDLVETVVPFVVNTLAEQADGIVIVLDDYHVIEDRACHRLVASVVDSLPPEVRVVVVTRTTPPLLRLGRRRVAGTLGEIGPEELAFEDAETELLLNGPLHLGLDRDSLAAIEERVGGWPAGLALVASSLATRAKRDGNSENPLGAALAHSRDTLSDYLSEEVLNESEPALRDFLRRTSILARLCGPLCTAVLQDPHAGELLTQVRRSNLFVTALDEQWVRYHDLLAEALADQLARHEPELVPELHRRASRWFEQAGMSEDAIEHALAAGDGPRAAALLADHWPALIADFRHVTVRRVLDRLPVERGGYGPFCDALDLVCRIAEGADQRLTHERAEALAQAHDDAPGVAPVLDMVLVSPFYGDVRRAVERGREAWGRRHSGGPVERSPFVCRFGTVLWFAGDPDAVCRLLEPRVSADEPTFNQIFTLSMLALAAADRDEGEVAERYAREAVAIVERIGGQSAFPHVYSALGEALRVAGKLEEAREHLSYAVEAEARLPGSIGYAMALVLDAQLALAQHDRGRARGRAAAAREIIDRYPDVGVLADRLAGVEAALARRGRDPLPGTEPSQAELRVLELLPTALTHEQIAARLYISIETVRSHLRRLYRRLGAHSREEAVAIARRRGLL